MAWGPFLFYLNLALAILNVELLRFNVLKLYRRGIFGWDAWKQLHVVAPVIGLAATMHGAVLALIRMGAPQ